MSSVTVTALRAFEHEGRTVTVGEPLEITQPVKALVLARKGFVSLARRYTTRALEPSPEQPPEPEQPKRRRRRGATAEGETTTRRRYRRSDMTAESE